MTKEKLIQMIKGLLETDSSIAFLMQLKKSELETLVACIRNRIDK